MSEKLPIFERSFWGNRLTEAKARKEVHRSIYDIHPKDWERIQGIHKKLLSSYVKPGQKILDAGCGYGALIPLLPQGCKEGYLGLDLSVDLVREGERLNPGYKFDQGDLRNLKRFPDKYFHMGICRSVEGMVKENMGEDQWALMQAELTRVCVYVLLLGYSDPHWFKIVKDWDEQDIQRSYVHGDNLGRITLRKGQDGTYEIFDLYVNEENRKAGIGRGLVKRVFDELDCHTVFGFCRENNPEGQAFYRSLGCELYFIPGFYRGTEGAYLFSVSKGTFR